MAEDITDANFKAKTAKGKVLVDFNATWCGPCKLIKPIFDKLSHELKDISFYAIDVDENPNAAEEFGVRSIPTMLYLKDGVEVDRTMGYMPEPTFRDRIKKTFG